MTERTLSTGARAAALAFVAAGALGLAACEEHAYPSAAPSEATSAPPPPDAPLAGAPSARTPEYVPPPPPPPGYAQPGYAAPPPGYGPPPPAYGRAPSGPPEIVTMAPIPNPPEPTHPAWRREHRGRRHYAYAPAYPAPYPAYRHHHHHHAWRAAPVYPAPAPHHAPSVAVPAVVHHPAAAHHASPAPHHAAPAAPAAPGAQLPKPAAPEHHHHHQSAAAAGAAATAAAASGGSTRTSTDANATANTTASTSEADRYQALQQALKDDFASAAELKAPAHMEANQSTTVTLTLPAEFAQTVRNEAAKQNLSDAAMTMNLVATLTGEGYTIVPDQAQTLPLTMNAPTTFSWKVTPTGSGRGALKAAVRADAVGAGHDLDLGSKSTGSGSATGRVVGIGLLALIALVLLGWAAQRRRPTPQGATKPRASHTNGTNP